MDTAADSAAIKAVYEKFFNHKTPQTESVKLLQNGEAFSAAIAAQAKSQLSQGSSATVSKVNVLTNGKATVTFTILIDGTPTLKDQGGWAVKEGGTWKVAGTTFCGLLTMEGSPPAVCMEAKSTTLPG